jgi:hypothetical protein
MSQHDVLRYKAGSAKGIALENARLCTVCWTIHTVEECPGCGARQWHRLITVLRSVAQGLENGDDGFKEHRRPHLRLVSG